MKSSRTTLARVIHQHTIGLHLFKSKVLRQQSTHTTSAGPRRRSSGSLMVKVCERSVIVMPLEAKISHRPQ